MRSRSRNRRRRGATLVEFAVVYPVLFIILFGILIGGIAVFRYQQVALLAREGARWASVHGAQYAKETGKLAATGDTVLSQAITPRQVILDSGSLTCAVAWDYDPGWVNGYDPNKGTYVNSTVTVTLSYRWLPEWGGDVVTMTSSSTVPMEY